MSAKLIKKMLSGLNIDEKYTKRIQKPKEFTKIKDNVNLQEDYNHMADLLILPTTKFGYRYLFVIVDLATDEFDIEPMKTKDPISALNAMRNCFKRNYIRPTFASTTTDGGSEFKGVFHSWLYNNSILHKTTMSGRHTQTSSVDNLCRQLSRIINGFMNAQEVATGKISKNWLPVIPTIREELNAIRKKKLPKKINSYEYPHFDPMKKIEKKGKAEYELIKPKFNKGQMVHRALDKPKNALGQDQNTTNFRTGDFTFDTTARKILEILYYSGKIKYRYLLDGLPNVSYTEKQLMRV